MRVVSTLLGAAVLTAAVTGASSQAAAVDLNPLIEPAELAALLEAGADVQVIDIRSPSAEDGAPSFATGHVPGAVNAPYGQWRGPSENPGELIAEADITDLGRRVGLDDGDAVIVVHQGANQTGFGAAARVYWTLKSAGVAEIAILDGGIQGWTDAGFALQTDAAPVTPGTFTAAWRNDWNATRDDVRTQVEAGEGGVLLDARPLAFFQGENKHSLAQRPGTLPGAQQLENFAFFDGDSPRLADQDVIKAVAAAQGFEQGSDITSFCNTGHWAATSWFALSEVAEIDNVRLYAESAVGWGNAGLPLDNEPSALEWGLNSAKQWLDRNF